MGRGRKSSSLLRNHALRPAACGMVHHLLADELE
eukprot:CAMPEP_0119420684 /NCGR_PEP_ID=MMETSP1335-20130426/24094_1 /TAXON_ID=259385 /ORGANISM="Chrysoculter rhomboideus, Strain RCC1486" /LENGTH=33 /DNA_ID= /DNA_START= /DNA_END= /DNA_ORIENTATION=